MALWTFNGTTDTAMGLTTTDIRRSVMPEVKRSTQEVAGMHGAYLMQAAVGERRIEIDVNFSGTTMADAIADTRTLAQYLYSPTPLELLFTDDPDIVFYAQLDGATDLEAIGAFRRGTIVFVCSDPFAYTTTPTEVAIDTGAANPTVVGNDGGLETYPVIELAVDGSTTFIEVICEDTNEYVYVGTAAEAGSDTPTEPLTINLDEHLTQTMEWTYGTTSAPDTASYAFPTMEMDAASITMRGVTDDAYIPADCGDAVVGKAWHGPFVYHALTSPVTDFAAEYYFFYDIDSDVGQTLSWPTPIQGTIDFLLRDGAGTPAIIAQARIAKLSPTLGDITLKLVCGDPNGTLGTDYVVMYDAKVPQTVNGSLGIWQYMAPGRIKLARVGNLWSYELAYDRNGDLAHGPTPMWLTVVSGSFVDENSISTADAASVGFCMGQTGTVAQMFSAVNRVKVSGASMPVGVGTTIIATAGQTFTFDMRQGTVLLDGSTISNVPAATGGFIPMSALVHYTSSFFALPTGDSDIAVVLDPGVDATGTVTVTERWL